MKLFLLKRIVRSVSFRYWHFLDRKFHHRYRMQVLREVRSLINSVKISTHENRVLITSYSNKAIPVAVVNAQDSVLRSLLTKKTHYSYCWLPLRSRTRAMHYQWIDAVLSEAFRKFDIVLIIDVDCVPYSINSLDYFVEQAISNAQNFLVGVEQVSPGHNTGHFYASPVACCISRNTYRALGSPSAIQDLNGDVMESFTFAAESRGVPIKLIRVMDVVGPRLWKFPDGREFGIGTVYGRNGMKLFFHNFCSSTKPDRFLGFDHTSYFIRECQSIVNDT